MGSRSKASPWPRLKRPLRRVDRVNAGGDAVPHYAWREDYYRPPKVLHTPHRIRRRRKGKR